MNQTCRYTPSFLITFITLMMIPFLSGGGREGQPPTFAIATGPPYPIKNFGCKGLSYWFDLAIKNRTITNCLNQYPSFGGAKVLTGYTYIAPSVLSNLNLIMPNCTCIVASYYLSCFSRQNCTLSASANQSAWESLTASWCGDKPEVKPLGGPAIPPVWQNASASGTWGSMLGRGVGGWIPYASAVTLGLMMLAMVQFLI